MYLISGHNSHGSNTYTITTLTQGSSQVDLFPISDFGPVPVNVEVLAAVENELGTFSGVTWIRYTVTGQVRSTVLEPSSISGATHDWSPSGWSTGPHEIICVTATGLTPSITGLTGGSHGRRASLCNAGSVAISLPAQDTNSAPANRFVHAGLLGAFSLAPDAGIDMIYHGGSVNRWRFLG